VRRDLDRVGAQINLTVIQVAFHAPELAHWDIELERSGVGNVQHRQFGEGRAAGHDLMAANRI